MAHEITLDKAKVLTFNYRKVNEIEISKGFKYEKAKIQEILDNTNPDCVALRIYYGRNAIGEDTLVLVGVDANGNDITTNIAEYGISTAEEFDSSSQLATDQV